MTDDDNTWMPAESRTLRFPPGLVDREGLRLRPGSSVDVVGGPHLGSAGEVVGWVRGGNVEVLTSELLLITVSPFDLDRTDRDLDVSATMHREIEEIDAPRTLLVATVGGSEIEYLPGVDADAIGIDPQLDDERGRLAWSEACLARANEVPEPDRATWVARHFDAPILGRVLREAALGPTIDRLTMVATQQNPAHPDDSWAQAELLRLWVEGTDHQRSRSVLEITDPIILRHAPHVVDAVLHFTQPGITERAADVVRIAVKRTGGTPAMGFGILLAAIGAERPDQTVRDIHVPEDQPIIEMDVNDGHIFAGLRPSPPTAER